MVECEICGRHLRTGRKYCYSCRGLQYAREGGGRWKKSSPISKLIGVIFAIIIFCFIMPSLLFFENMPDYYWIGIIIFFVLGFLLIHKIIKSKQRRKLKFEN